jgi:asparagine synthase (glutamine-hydrolysing)
MSVQTGIRYFDGQQASHVEVACLLHGLKERGPDYVSTCVKGSIGLGFRGFNVAPQDRLDQPLRGPSDSVITFDGRLDNREELVKRLGLGGMPTDAALALAAFECWGTQSFELLAGEYALVLWDAFHGALFLVRSRCGTRPLFYIGSASKITWSSEIDDLVVKSNIPPEVNDAYAIGYLYYQPDIDESPFHNVVVVPCGSYVAVTPSGKIRPPVSTWHPENLTPIKLSSDSEYEEAWRQQVESAVASRLRASKSVFCELSGGLDSSTIALLAHRVLANSARDPAMLTTVSCTYEKSTWCDETAFILMVEQSRKRAGVHVTERSQEATLGLEDVKFTGVPNTSHCFPGRYRVTEELMKRTGARILLTGIGGDHIFWSDPTGSPELADLLIRWRLLATISMARRWSQAAAMPLWQVLIASAVGPITVANRFLRWHPPDVNLRPWITNCARRYVTGTGRSQALRVNTSIGRPSLRVRVQAVRALYALISAGYFQEYYGIYFSHPLAHQQLIDFVLSLPIDQLARPGEDRSLMRRAMRGLLPERVRTRKSKGSIDEMFCRALEREQQSIGPASALEVCRRGYANPEPLAKAIREVALGRLDHSYALVRLFSLERWLRSLGQIASRRLTLESPGAEYVFDSTNVATRLSR